MPDTAVQKKPNIFVTGAKWRSGRITIKRKRLMIDRETGWSEMDEGIHLRINDHVIDVDSQAQENGWSEAEVEMICKRLRSLKSWNRQDGRGIFDPTAASPPSTAPPLDHGMLAGVGDPKKARTLRCLYFRQAGGEVIQCESPAVADPATENPDQLCAMHLAEKERQKGQEPELVFEETVADGESEDEEPGSAEVAGYADTFEDGDGEDDDSTFFQGD